MRKRYVIAVFLICTLALGYWGLMMLREVARRASCRPYILLGVCRNYAEEHEGMYPPLSPRYGQLIFDQNTYQWGGVWLDDCVCESDPDLPRVKFHKHTGTTPVNDWSYFYLGYFLENEIQGMALIEAYHDAIRAKGNFVGDLVVDGLNTCHTQNILYRLREPDRLPPEAACLEGLASSIPVIMEWPGHHRDGAHVVYLDGHQEFVSYPGKFPMTQNFIEALQRINAEIYPIR